MNRRNLLKLSATSAALQMLPGLVLAHPLHQADQPLLVARRQRAVGGQHAAAAGHVGQQRLALQIRQAQCRPLKAWLWSMHRWPWCSKPKSPRRRL